MKVKTIEGYDCPECGMFILREDLGEVTARYQCGECEKVYEDKDMAEECCKE